MKHASDGRGRNGAKGADFCIRRFRLILTLVFSVMVFAVFVLTMFVTVGVLLLLLHTGILDEALFREESAHIPMLVLAAASIVVGTALSGVMLRIPLRPIHTLIDGMNRLAQGDFSVRIDLGEHHISRQLSDSFNALAGELENTEMLRSDFINNFSHEFKTPIVSVFGFARLLRRGKLTEEQRSEYLKIIEEESGRLSAMATNVLNLTKVENQTILTDVTRFNLSEQLRSCVLLLEKKWEAKQLSLSLEFNEYLISANEELLRQVWINLLDNAVKFSPERGEIRVEICRREDTVTVSVANGGEAIPEKDLPMIMNKFYQADSSHKQEGNGIGLAIVRKIVALHKGEIRIQSGEDGTVFAVSLPDEEN